MDLSRSVWQENESSKDIWSFFCPQCKVPRKIPYRPRPAPRHYAQIALTTLVFTLLSSSWFTWKGVVAFVPIWTVFELVYRSKVRAALSCENCGFDPILYLVDVKRARQEIEQHWRKKYEDRGIPFPEKGAPQGVKPPSTRTSLAQAGQSGLEEELSNTSGNSTPQ